VLYAAVIVLFNKDSEVLVVKRSSAVDTFAGYWCFPGGGADKGETAPECAIRETFEETSLIANPHTLIFLDTIIKEENKEVHFFASFDWQGEVKIDWESSDYQWIHPTKLRELKFLPSPEPMIKVLEIWADKK